MSPRVVSRNVRRASAVGAWLVPSAYSWRRWVRPELGRAHTLPTTPVWSRFCGAVGEAQRVPATGQQIQARRGLPRTQGPLTHNSTTLLRAHHQGSGVVLQPNAVLLIHLLELQLQPGILSLSLAELALAGGQHLGVEAALSLCPMRWSFTRLIGPLSPRSQSGHNGLTTACAASRCPAILASSWVPCSCWPRAALQTWV